MIHEMLLKDKPFQELALGEKNVVMRIYSGISLNKGDYIIYSNETDTAQKIAAQVKATQEYPSLSELFSEVSLRHKHDNTKSTENNTNNAIIAAIIEVVDIKSVLSEQ